MPSSPLRSYNIPRLPAKARLNLALERRRVEASPSLLYRGSEEVSRVTAVETANSSLSARAGGGGLHYRNSRRRIRAGARPKQDRCPVCEANSALSPAFRARYRPPVSVRKIPFPGPRDGEAGAEAERLPMTTRRIRGARKGAGWISGVRLEPEPAPAVRWRAIARTRASAGRSGA